MGATDYDSDVRSITILHNGDARLDLEDGTWLTAVHAHETDYRAGLPSNLLLLLNQRLWGGNSSGRCLFVGKIAVATGKPKRDGDVGLTAFFGGNPILQWVFSQEGIALAVPPKSPSV